jgi:hypothetical protein
MITMYPVGWSMLGIWLFRILTREAPWGSECEQYYQT